MSPPPSQSPFWRAVLWTQMVGRVLQYIRAHQIYPTGQLGREHYYYKRQRQISEYHDANGTQHRYEYDRLGRQIQDRLIAVAPHIDSSVRRIETQYDDRRLLTAAVRSYDHPESGQGSALNEVRFQYNSFRQLSEDRQEHAGASSPNSPAVQYEYADGAHNSARRTAIVYPQGRRLSYGYGDAGGADDVLSRVAELSWSNTPVCRYSYAGLARYVGIDYPQPDVSLSYRSPAGAPTGDSGDPYGGYDRFGRTIDMRWTQGTGESEVSLNRVQYAYDRAGNRIWRRDAASPEGGHDKFFQYDSLYQVVHSTQGTLNLSRTAIGAIPAAGEAFTYDPTGNWLRYERSQSGVVTLDQSRVSNQGNQLVQIDESSRGLHYDLAGNALQTPPSEGGDFDQWHQLTWDGWNRLVAVRDSTGTLIASYAYDGISRRITVTHEGSTTHTYWSDRWKPLEKRQDTSSDAITQYVWGARPGHRDELILRDRDTDGDGDLDERLYCLMDYYDPISVVDTSGAVVERYDWSAFGLRTVLSPTWQARSASAVEMDFGFHGQFIDEETGWYNYGYRYYVPWLGRWVNRDPIGERGGMDLYVMAENDGVGKVDVLGLSPTASEVCSCLDIDVKVMKFGYGIHPVKYVASITQTTEHLPYNPNGRKYKAYLKATWKDSPGCKKCEEDNLEQNLSRVSVTRSVLTSRGEAKILARETAGRYPTYESYIMGSTGASNPFLSFFGADGTSDDGGDKVPPPTHDAPGTRINVRVKIDGNYLCWQNTFEITRSFNP